VQYGVAEQVRIVREVRRTPTCEAEGRVLLKGVEHTTNAVVHEWLRTQLLGLPDELPNPSNVLPTWSACYGSNGEKAYSVP